ncbi:MAG: TetR/AcrR family transcriptional regulator [Steroidobacteraceae bacterium]
MNAAPATPETRQRLVVAALELFWEKGYGSTSIADILGRANANAGSLYHFFPTKQDLLLEVLDTYHRGIDAMLLQPAWAGIDDPLQRVFALLARYRGLIEMTECAYGCPIGSLALELHEPDLPVRQRLANNFSAWTDAVERCFAAVPTLPPDVDRRRLAEFALTTMEGGVMLTRTYRDARYFDRAVATLRDYLARLTGASPGAGLDLPVVPDPVPSPGRARGGTPGKSRARKPRRTPKKNVTKKKRSK